MEVFINQTRLLPKPCSILEYPGEEDYEGKIQHEFVNGNNSTFGLNYQFTPPESVTVNEEYLIYRNELSLYTL